jgi:hypothetical protein
MSTPASRAFFVASALSSAAPWFTHSPMAPKSEINTPSNPISSLRISLISHLFTLAGIPLIVLKDVITNALPASTASLYAGR